MRLLIAGPGHRPRAAWRCWLLGVMLLGVVACSLDGTDQPADDSEEAEAPEAAADPVGAPDLTCADGRPCTWDEVGEETLAETTALADELAIRLADEHDGTLAWLARQDGVAEATADGRGIRVRMANGRPVWVFTSAAFAPVPDTGDHPDEAGGGADGGSEADADAVGRTRAARPVAVVGDDPRSKSALALSPVSEEWGAAFDDARHVADILEGTRGYEGNVTYVDESAIGLDWFAGWDAYDTVMVSTHGVQHCSPVCTTVLDTGIAAEMDETDELWHTPGIELIRHPDERDGGWSVGVTTDFFRSAYPGGLDETLVLLSACETAADTDLVGHLAGSSSVVLGWSHVVRSDDATRASTALFREMSEHGSTSGEAMEVLRDRGLGAGQATVPSEGLTVLELVDGEWVRDGQPTEQRVGDASLRRHQGGDDLRVREVVELQNPHNGGVLSSGEQIWVDRRGDDGDHLPVRIEVDGMPEGEDRGLTATLEVTDADDGRWSLADAEVERVDAHTVRITDELALGMPVEELDALEMRATVTLPEGGQSVHQVTVEPTGALTLHWDVEWTTFGREPSVGTVHDGLTASAVVPLEAVREGNRTVFSGAAPPDVTTEPSLCPGLVEGEDLTVERLVFDQEAVTGELLFDWPAAEREQFRAGTTRPSDQSLRYPLLACAPIEWGWDTTKLHAAGADLEERGSAVVAAGWEEGSGGSIMDYRMHHRIRGRELRLHVRLVPGVADESSAADA